MLGVPRNAEDSDARTEGHSARRRNAKIMRQQLALNQALGYGGSPRLPCLPHPKKIGACLTGELTLLDARVMLASFMAGNLPHPARFRAAMGSMIERGVDELANRYSFSLLCAYSATALVQS